MTGDFTICTTKFALVQTSHPKFNDSGNYLKEGREQLLIDLMCNFSCVNCFHSKEIDLLILKQPNDIPGWYSLFTNAYKLQL